jgi:hypothetical protein
MVVKNCSVCWYYYILLYILYIFFPPGPEFFLWRQFSFSHPHGAPPFSSFFFCFLFVLTFCISFVSYSCFLLLLLSSVGSPPLFGTRNNSRCCRLLYREFVMLADAHSFTEPRALTFSSFFQFFFYSTSKIAFLFSFLFLYTFSSSFLPPVVIIPF